MKTQLILLLLFLLIVCNGHGQAIVWCFPDTGKFNTGSTDGIELSEKSLIKTQSGGGEVGWARFNISLIPVEAIIQNVQFNIFISENNNAYWFMMSMENDPLLGTPSSIYNDCTNGMEYFWWEGDFSAPGWANMNMWSEGTLGFQNSLQQGWFAMSFWEDETPPIWAVEIHGWDEPRPPYLKVEFDLPPDAPQQAYDPFPFGNGGYAELEVDLSWSFGDNTDMFDLYFGSELPHLDKVIENGIAISNGNYDPGALKPGRTYYWQVISKNNTNGIQTPGEMWHFNTDCKMFETPIKEGFEGMFPPEMPVCWSTYISENVYEDQIRVVEGHGINGSNSLWMSVGAETEIDILFISPKIIGGVSGKYINFYSRSPAYHNLLVGTMTDPTDLSTFNEVLYVNLQDNSPNFEEVQVIFSGYLGEDEFIAIKVVPFDIYNVIIIDEIEIGETVELSLSVFIEGPFNGADMNAALNNIDNFPLIQPFNIHPWYYDGDEAIQVIPNSPITDWVLVELRDANSADSAFSTRMIARQAAFLLRNGSIVAIDGASNLRVPVSINQNLYVVIWQRNHLGIMSNNALSLSEGVYSYNFSSDVYQAYGGINAHKEVAPGIWGMIGGDNNSDGEIDINDYLYWENSAGTSSYYNADNNLDGQVDNKDKNDVCLPNLGKGSQVPE